MHRATATDKTKLRVRKAPQQARSKMTVDAVLQAAARLLAQQGLTGMTTTRVAEVAGVSVGTLYQYFPTKQAIVAELLKRYVDEVRATLTQLESQAASMSLASQARHIIEGVIAIKKRHVHLHQALIRESGTVDDRNLLRSMVTDIEAAIVRMLQRFPEYARHDDVPRLARNLTSAINGIIRDTFEFRPEDLGDDRFVDELVELALRYVAKDGPQT